MAATIIDSLIVTLGLDNAEYMKRAKESQAQQRKFRDDTKKTSNDIADGLATVGRQAAGLFLGFEGLKGAVSFLAGLVTSNANLGRFAANLGQSAHEVNTWTGAVELAGGSVKDAEADLQGLSQSITDLKATGTVSPMLLLFQRLGVAIYDANGKTRKFADIFKDAGDKLRTFNRADAANLARNAGLSDSTLNLIIQQGKARDELLRKSEANNQVNEETIKQAEQLQENWRQIGQSIRGAANQVERFAAPAILTSFKWISEHGTGVKDFFIGLALVLTAVFLPAIVAATIAAAPLLAAIVAIAAAAGAVGYVIHRISEDHGKASTASSAKLGRYNDRKLGPAASGFKRGDLPRAPLHAAPPHPQNNAENNNPGDLRFAGQRGATVGAHGFAAFPTLAAGIQAANTQLDLYAKRGVNTIASIVAKWAPVSENDTASYIAQVEKSLGKNRNAQLTPADRQRLLQAIFKREGVNKVGSNDIASALGPNQNALATAQFANNQTPNGQRDGTGARTSNTKVEIDSITVHTQATDADGMAADMRGAIDRKGVISQADTGMT